MSGLDRINHDRMQQAYRQDIKVESFLQEHRLRGAGWLGEQLGWPTWKVYKTMKRLGIELRHKTGPAPGRGHFWAGGRIVDKSGYVLLYRPDHPRRNSGGYVREHRLVMEEELGRPLLASEVVHHLNADRADNRPENLHLYESNGPHMAHEWTGRKHTPETREKMSRSALARWERVHQAAASRRVSEHGGQE